jgi:hypothetical protein
MSDTIDYSSATAMAYHFKKHYTREEARALLPQIRQWLKRMGDLRADLEKFEARVSAMMSPGCDVGGESVNRWVRALADLEEVLQEFNRRDIQLKDMGRGLLDFPAIIGGKEVFLCWEQDEEDVEFWHDLDAGYAGRERL